MGITLNASRVILCQSDILERAAILDGGQEGAVKVSCYFLLSPENYALFSSGSGGQREVRGRQVEN